MKLTIFMLPYLMVAMGQDCSNCEDFVKKLVAFLVKPEMIKIESEFFKMTVCNGDALCDKLVDQYWAQMGQAYSNFSKAESLTCKFVPVLCGLKVTDCNSCSQGVMVVSKLFQAPCFQTGAETFLAAPYCNTVPLSEICRAFVEKYASQAFTLLGTRILAPYSGFPVCDGVLQKGCRSGRHTQISEPPKNSLDIFDPNL